MTFHLGTTSLSRLDKPDMNPDLVKVIKLAITKTPIDFTVLETLRSIKRQQHLVDIGASKTMNSRHITGHAVDIAPIENGKIPWNDLSKFNTVAKAVFEAADELGIVIQWGGDWDLDGDWRDESFYDGPHYQIPWPYRIKDAKAAQERRMAARDLAREMEPEPETDPEPELSPDITPGLSPEDMKDEEFEPGWPAGLEGPKE